MIETLTDNELVAELRKRHDALVVIGWKDRTKTLDETRFDWSGGKALVLGLLRFAEMEMQSVINKQERSLP